AAQRQVEDDCGRGDTSGDAHRPGQRRGGAAARRLAVVHLVDDDASAAGAVDQGEQQLGTVAAAQAVVGEREGAAEDVGAPAADRHADADDVVVDGEQRRGLGGEVEVDTWLHRHGVHQPGRVDG